MYACCTALCMLHTWLVKNESAFGNRETEPMLRKTKRTDGTDVPKKITGYLFYRTASFSVACVAASLYRPMACPRSGHKTPQRSSSSRHQIKQTTHALPTFVLEAAHERRPVSDQMTWLILAKGGLINRSEFSLLRPASSTTDSLVSDVG